MMQGMYVYDVQRIFGFAFWLTRKLYGIITFDVTEATVTVMLVTKNWWWFVDVDDIFWMLVSDVNVKRWWMLGTKIAKTVSPISHSCNQLISSSTSVTNIDVTKWSRSKVWLVYYNLEISRNLIAHLHFQLEIVLARPRTAKLLFSGISVDPSSW